MSNEHINPDTLFDSSAFGFTQVVASEGRRIVHCSGQTAWDRALNIVGGDDLGAQTDFALENVGRALAAAGARPADVARLRIYVVRYQPEMVETITARIAAFFAPAPPPASTLLGVQALALPEFLIEIEATAVLD